MQRHVWITPRNKTSGGPDTLPRPTVTLLQEGRQHPHFRHTAHDTKPALPTNTLPTLHC
jgi:hypothetical protein